MSQDAVDRIINREDKTLKTIDSSLDLISQPGNTYTDFKLKGLGLQQALIGLAELHALRLSKLGVLVYKLEEKILEDDFLGNLEDPKILFSLYRLTQDSLTASSEYVQAVVKNVDWSKFENDMSLAVLNEGVHSEDPGISAAAKELLNLAAAMAAKARG